MEGILVGFSSDERFESHLGLVEVVIIVFDPCTNDNTALLSSLRSENSPFYKISMDLHP